MPGDGGGANKNRTCDLATSSERSSRSALLPACLKQTGNAHMDTINNETFVAYMQHAENIQRRQPHTIRTYRYTLTEWLEFLGDKSMRDVRPHDLEQWAARIRRTGSTPAAATMRREIVVVRNFHQWAFERDFPAAPLSSAYAPTQKSRTPRPIDDAVWLKFWQSPMPDSDRMWLGLGYFCGLRRSEIVTLKPEDIHADEGVMTFIRKGGSPEPVEYVAMGAAIEELPVHAGFDQWLDIFHATVEDRYDIGANLVWWEGTGDPLNDPTRINKRLTDMLWDRM